MLLDWRNKHDFTLDSGFSLRCQLLAPGGSFRQICLALMLY